MKQNECAVDAAIESVVRERVGRLCRRYPGGILEEEDIVNRILLRLNRVGKRYTALSGDASKKLAWKVIGNEIRRYAVRLKSESKRREREVRFEELDFTDELEFAGSPESLKREDLRRDVLEAIAKMPPKERSVIEAYYLGEGMREIARRRGIALSTFQSREWKRAKESFIKNFRSMGE